MATTQPVVVYNHDVAGCYYRMNRFIEEVNLSVSSGVSLTGEFDIARLKSYLDSIDRYHAWVKQQPQLDLPETSPREIVLDAPPVATEVENDDLADVARMLTLARDELTNSQSSRLGSGLTTHDSNRLTSVVAKVRAFLLDYIVPTTPLDLPESSPRDPLAGTGRIGV